MRDMPLNKKKQKEGCIFLSILITIFIIGMVLVHYTLNK